MRVRATLSLFPLLIGVSCSQALTAQNSQPQRGQWIVGPVGNRHDLSNDAVTSGTFRIQGPEMPATIFFACKGNDAGPPTLELRAVVGMFRGYSADAVSKKASVQISEQMESVPLDSFPVQGSVFLVATLTPAEVQAIGSSPDATGLGGISLSFVDGQRTGAVTADMPARNAATDAVLRACHVPISAAKTSRPVAGLAPAGALPAAPIADGGYNFEGIAIGMTKAQAIAAAKLVATTPVTKGDGGGLTFTTKDVSFVNVATNDQNVVDSFVVCGLPVKGRRATAKSGPLYDLAVKAYGAPTGRPPQGQSWVQWDIPGRTNLYYSWDGAEAPTGCLYVSTK